MFKPASRSTACPVNNLYEATTFLLWALALALPRHRPAATLEISSVHSHRRYWFAVGVFALMPVARSAARAETGFLNWLTSLHAATSLLAYGTFASARSRRECSCCNVRNLKNTQGQCGAVGVPVHPAAGRISTRLGVRRIYFADHRPCRRTRTAASC